MLRMSRSRVKAGARAGLLITLLLMAAAAIAPVVAASPVRSTNPSIQVSPSSAAPGEQVTLVGSGWSPGGTVVARFYQAGQTGSASADLAMARTVNQDGTFTTPGTVPPTLFGPGSRANLAVIPGSYTIVASDGSASAAASFTVRAPAHGVLLWGEVAFDTDGNGQLDGTDTPAGSAGVTIQGAAVPGARPSQAITDALGHFALVLSAGTYQLTAQSQYQQSTWSGSRQVVAGDRSTVQGDLLLRPSVSISRPERCFVQTRFCVDDDRIWNYLIHRGGVTTLGYPVSRTFLFLGYPSQFFQRVILQDVPGVGVRPMNLLDPGLMPYNRINGATFPPHDPIVATRAPGAATPDYGNAVSDYLRPIVPNVWNGIHVGFLDAYLAVASGTTGGDPVLVALEVWGFPTSRPAFDPNNHGFVYQRFQRGILHFQGTDASGRPITAGVLLADWLKSLITGVGLPADLEAQAAADHSRLLRQYCPFSSGWICRPGELPDSDLTGAFESQLNPVPSEVK